MIVLSRSDEASTAGLADCVTTPTPQKAEGYALKIEGSHVVVKGRDGRGVYHGAQTLRQLLRLDDGGVYLKAASVRDWPSLKVRGVHWFGGPNSLPFHKRMIDRIASPLKMNTMLYQADFTKWDSQPNLWGDSRMTDKKDVKAAFDYARGHYMTSIPIIQGMGHSDWFFANGQNRDLACDPNKLYSFDPTNPKAYEILLSVWTEALDLLKPEVLHIGHDEITDRGRIPAERHRRQDRERVDHRRYRQMPRLADRTRCEDDDRGATNCCTGRPRPRTPETPRLRTQKSGGTPSPGTSSLPTGITPLDRSSPA